MTRRLVAGLVAGAVLALGIFVPLWAAVLISLCWGVALALIPWRCTR